MFGVLRLIPTLGKSDIDTIQLCNIENMSTGNSLLDKKWDHQQ